jgi:hypothetical protein
VKLETMRKRMNEAQVLSERLQSEVNQIDALTKTPEGRVLINRAIARLQRRIARSHLNIARIHKQIAEQFEARADSIEVGETEA